MKPFRIGAIGSGQIVREQHFPVLDAIPEAKLAWVADMSASTARSVAGAYQIEAADPENLESHLERTDVVLIAIPYGARAKYYDLIADRSPHLSIYIEKPLARTVAEHNRIAHLRPAHQVACGLSRRSTTTVDTVRRMMADHFWGNLKECRFGVGGLGGFSVGEKYYGDARLSGGGMLMEIGVHCLDAVLFCTGAVPGGELSGQIVLDHEIDVHVDGRTTLLLPDDRQVPFEFECSLLKDTIQQIELVFDAHTVSFSLFDNKGVRVVRRGGKDSYTLIGANTPLTSYQALARFWFRFFSGIQSGIANETSAVSSIGTTQFVEAAYTLADRPTVNIPPIGVSSSVRNV